MWFLYRFFRLLLWLPPEWAHRLAIFSLKGYQWWHFRLWRRRLSQGQTFSFLQSPPFSVRSKIGLAAGLDKNAEVFAALGLLGFGFIEIGTVTPKPQAGNAKPRLWRVPPLGLANQMGFNSCGVAEFKRHILRYRSSTEGLTLLANIGRNRQTPNEKAIDDYKILILQLQDVVDGFVVNVSSPNTPRLMALQNVAFLEALTPYLPNKTANFVKLSPDLNNNELIEITKWISGSSAWTGLVLTNTSRVLCEKYTTYPGGLSGELLFERSLECVRLAHANLPTGKIIIGVGGITTPQRAKVMFEAGANLIEVFTGFIYGGPSWLRGLKTCDTSV